jgi:hypothetical protein
MNRLLALLLLATLPGCTNLVQAKAERTAAFPRSWDDPDLTPPAAPQQPAPRRVPAKGRLAVLDLRSYAPELQPQDVRYFADLVRGATLKAAPMLDVMTRENLLVLLQATGKDLASCEGECEVDTGRRIGADLVVSGDLLKVGTRFKVSLKVHDTHEGKLLSTVVASGKSVEELDDELQKAALQLFER